MAMQTHDPTDTTPQTPTPASWWRRHRLGIAGWTLGLAAIIWFFGIQPRLVTTVDEPFPAAAPPAAVAATAGNAPVASLVPVAPTASAALAAGTFVPAAHPGSGTATLTRLADGTTTLRLENFATDNGPDLRVILRGAGGATLDLGGLRGNAGNQSYTVPADTDLSRYNAAEIWCRAFNITFTRATLA